MSNLSASYCKYILKFAFPAKTSRNTLFEKVAFYIKITDTDTGVSGIGECCFIEGLSIDNPLLFEKTLSEICKNINNGQALLNYSQNFPAIQAGLETAFLNLSQPETFKLFENDFYSGRQSIPINGLIWMNNFEEMKKQIAAKLDECFNCIKIKIGAYNFKEEFSFLKKIRTEFGKNFQLRLDANGAFKAEEALEKLKILSDLDLHSVEQPIKAGQWEEMAILCLKSPVLIALDEELIGCDKISEMLQFIKPAFIVLKPSLLGGFTVSNNWIATAQKLNINWWATSALESNIGLNAIAQWLSTKSFVLHQGLGTGKIYSNNIPSPLKVEQGKLHYCTKIDWNINALNFNNIS